MSKTICFIVFAVLMACGLLILLLPKKKVNVLSEDELFEKQYREREALKMQRQRKRRKKKGNRKTIATLMRDAEMSKGTAILYLVAGAAGGTIIGKFFFSNNFIMVLCGMVGMALPLFIMNMQASKVKTLFTTQLEATMRVLTNAYLADGDFIRSVKNNISQIEYAKPFKVFLTSVEQTDPNVEKALRKMDISVNNSYFTQWINLVILAQTDREMMRLLPSIIENMNQSRCAEIKARTAMMSVWQDYFTMLAMVLAIPLIIKFMMPDWYVNLTTNPIGIITIIFTIAAIVFSVIIAVKIDKPIDEA